MLEVLQFYVSGFWVWLGLTIGMAVMSHGLLALVGVIGVIIGSGRRSAEKRL